MKKAGLSLIVVFISVSAKTNYIVPAEYDRLESLCRELRITLISSINTVKGNIK